MNEEDFSRYIPESDCDYIIEQRLKQQVERDYLEDANFRVALSIPFLDASSTQFPYRSFYYPLDAYEKQLRYNPYYLLRRVAKEDIEKREEKGEMEIQLEKDKIVLPSSEQYLNEENEL